MYLLDVNIATRIIIGISAMTLLFVSFLIAFISNQRRKLQYHKNLHALHEQQKELLTKQNEQLEQNVKERTIELEQQKEALQKSLADLKAAQLQLVQREKMASLGELTAGIAHEIQNPLNFVNNFSEVSKELADEMDYELARDNLGEAQLLSKSLRENLEKIAHHGKRAEGIVKGMLQHSRAISEEKEPADINEMAEEYLNLSYHSFAVKHKGFQVNIKTDFDKTIDRINVYPLDLGRVFINLYTNAFYSMHEKNKHVAQYEPELFVSTRKTGNFIQLRVKDNGTGIPEKVLSKIYQPFFTTKPTGDGTGLGLSISYDIITRAHGGEIKVESKDGEGAEFIVQLPVGG